MVSQENSNWVFDFNYNIDELQIPNPDTNFSAPSFAFNNCHLQPPLTLPFNVSAEIEGNYGDSEGPRENNSKKRGRSESCGPSSSKACREKARRDRLNDKFMELGSILEPGRTPKTDKAAILSDAVRMVTQLRSEAQKLKDSNSSLQEKIKELKTEKNELRDEKQRLKAEKEKLEQQLKTVNTQPGFMPAPTPIPATFAPPTQAPGGKLVPFMGYPGVAMWQFMPPASVDTSQDHVLRPPVA
ncbi:transcription factor ILR3-like [Amaranthus tricolor]|uniref:transcription factor ILR3-like n=1 Tax=Amaranthus tricolor TaxID=29722 RepID=UPI0025892478|nr:transcription factor ILR3-like [Amaranthus tricolor]